MTAEKIDISSLNFEDPEYSMEFDSFLYKGYWL